MSLLKNIFNKTPRLTTWEQLGTLKEKFEIPYLHPFHHNYPAWKGGERWLNLLDTHWNTRIVFTRGLAFSKEEKGYEFYLETTEVIEHFSSSWQANLIYELGKIIPNVNDLAERLNNYKYLSLQIDIEGAPEDWSLHNSNGNISLLLGLPNGHLANFAPSYFTPLNVKLLRPTEMQYIVNNGAEGRTKLASLLAQQGNVSISSLDRNPVL